MTFAGPADAALDALVVAIKSLGETTARDTDVVRLPSLGVKASIAEIEVPEGAAVVVYDLSSLEGDGPGLRVLAVGYGDSQEKALGEAAFQWVTGVLTVVRHWLSPSRHTCLAEDLDMLVRDQESQEDFGWRVHFGPILSRAHGPGADDALVPAEHLDFIRVLFDHVHHYAAHKTLFWIEAFAVRHADGGVDATCNLHNQDWPEGRSALVHWALGWVTPAATMVSARQFLLFEPLPPSRLRGRRQLRKALENGTARKDPWWRRILSA